MYSMDDFLRLNAGASVERTIDRNRARAGLRARQRTTDVDAFLSSCGVKGRRR